MFDEASDALSLCARCIASTYIEPDCLEAFTACQLIPLDKNPGMRPIGIGETIHKIIGKAILNICNNQVFEAVGCLQLCGGLECGIECAIHAMRDIYNDSEAEGILLADVSNAFNNLN